nr:MAG TPA: hypothetical protein [Caudoviricetes sp.]
MDPCQDLLQDFFQDPSLTRPKTLVDTRRVLRRQLGVAWINTPYTRVIIGRNSHFCVYPPNRRLYTQQWL